MTDRVAQSESRYSSIQFSMLWIFATAFGWFVSTLLSTNLILGIFLLPLIALSGDIPTVMISIFQWWLLRSRVREASLWIAAGALESTISWQFLLYKFSGVTPMRTTEGGLWIGLATGVCQAIVLSRWVKWYAISWIPVSVVAWTMGWTIYSRAPNRQRFEPFWDYAALAGRVVGIITGPVLIWLLDHSIQRLAQER